MRPNLGPKARHHYSETAELEQRELLLSLFGEALPRRAARVGRISRNLAQLIGAQTEIVMVSAITIMKVKGKHSEILYQDLDLLQHGFNTGRVQKDGTRHLLFLFTDPSGLNPTLGARV